MSSNKEVPFQYVAKASRSERDNGLDHLHYKQVDSKWVQIDKEEHDRLEAGGERVTSNNIHATVKPIAVMEWLVSQLSEPGDTILEPFSGSGTTGIAAMRMGRNCHLIELDEDGLYENIIRGRLQAARTDLLAEVDVWATKPHIELPGDEDAPSDEVQEISLGDMFGF